MNNNDPKAEPKFHIVDLNYISLYLKDFKSAVAFYTTVFGPPDESPDNVQLCGWKMGATWLTLFPSANGTHKDSNPRNAEFAIQVAAPAEVDALHQALLEAGAKDCWTPEDTTMYEPMRFSCVDDPFGVRIDIYCPL